MGAATAPDAGAATAPDKETEGLAVAVLVTGTRWGRTGRSREGAIAPVGPSLAETSIHKTRFARRLHAESTVKGTPSARVTSTNAPSQATPNPNAHPAP